MQAYVSNVLPLELRKVSLFFRGANVRGSYKACYKEWQTHLNCYLNYYNALKESLHFFNCSDSQKLAKHILYYSKEHSTDINRVKESYTKFILSFGNHLKSLCSRKVTGHYASGYMEAYIYDVSTNDYINYINAHLMSTLSKIKFEEVEVLLPTLKRNNTLDTANIHRRSSFGVPKKNTMVSTENKVHNQRIVKEKAWSSIPIKLTIGGKIIDVTPLLDMPEVKSYLEQHQKKVLKLQNAEKAAVLKLEIEALGFDVTIM